MGPSIPPILVSFHWGHKFHLHEKREKGLDFRASSVSAASEVRVWRLPEYEVPEGTKDARKNHENPRNVCQVSIVHASKNIIEYPLASWPAVWAAGAMIYILAGFYSGHQSTSNLINSARIWAAQWLCPASCTRGGRTDRRIIWSLPLYASSAKKWKKGTGQQANNRQTTSIMQKVTYMITQYNSAYISIVMSYYRI